MNDYNFWADLLDTFQSSPDWIKALWLAMPPGFVLALIALLTRFKVAGRQAGSEGELIYSVHRDADNQLRIVSHLAEGHPALVLLEPPAGETPRQQDRLL